VPPSRLLIALPDPTEAETLSTHLSRQSWQCTLAPRPDSAKSLLAAHPWDALLADPRHGGLDLLELSQRHPSPPPVLLLDGLGTIRDAVDSIRRGAFDYLSRPISPDQLALALRRAAQARELRTENERLRKSLGERFSIGKIETRDPRLARIAQLVAAIADTRVHVLIQGESGTGKTLLARTIHQSSSRSGAPFVEVSCGALPATLLESELFGHARGAFTGAVRDRAGLFEAADGGTLFLDEISSAPGELQVKLLRVLQDRAFERVGETRTRHADVRVIAATNRDLAAEVQAGRFREDLFYRIHVVSLELPPLRERSGDVPLLAEAFLQRFAQLHGRPVPELSREALARLCAAPWPGNVRQLENVIERAVLLGSGVIEPADLGLELASAPAAQAVSGAGGDAEAGVLPLKRALEEPEKRIIQRALALNDGNRQRTARMLGVNRTTLFNKMRKYRLLDAQRAGAARLDSPPGMPQATPSTR
jgi:two-component system response regulator AtoC